MKEIWRVLEDYDSESWRARMVPGPIMGMVARLEMQAVSQIVSVQRRMVPGME